MSRTQKPTLGNFFGIGLIALITALFMAISVAAFSQSSMFDVDQDEVFISQQTNNSPQVITDLAY
jgi:hypothetical protein|tara:strand:- start:176 stop:370 length:195 start_codon:yes stop_codon:yes gene_type:complete